MCKRFRNVLLAHSSFLLISHLYVFADGADCICDQEQHLVISGCCYRNKIWIIMWVFFVYFLLFFLFFFFSCLGLLQKVLKCISTLHGRVALYNFRKEQIEIDCIEAHRTDKG